MIFLSPLAGDLPDSEHEPAEAREAVEEILARPEYQEPGESIIERAGRAIGDAFGSLLDGLGFPAGGGATAWLAWLVLVAVAAGVIVYLVRALSGGRPQPLSLPEGESVLATTEQDVAAGDWQIRAREHEAAGRWREGLLCRYRALVVELANRGTITGVAGRTAGELAREVAAAAPGAASGFTPATKLFEDVWYGGAPCGPDGSERFEALAEATLQGREPAATAPSPVEVGR